MDASPTAMDRLRAEIALVRERLADAARAVEDRGHAMLLAETPLADNAYRVARENHQRIRTRLRELESALGALILEHEGPVTPQSSSGSRRTG